MTLHCKYCGIARTSHNDLELHQLICENYEFLETANKRMNFLCQYCGIIKTSQREVDMHEVVCRNGETIQENEKGDNTNLQLVNNSARCRKCSKTLKHTKNRQRHERTCPGVGSGMTNVEHRCRRCTKTFSFARNKTRHELTCRGSKSVVARVEHRCRTCAKTFSNSSNKRRHERVCKSTDSTLQDIERRCRKCTKMFKRVNNRHRHERTCRGSKSAGARVEHRCRTCAKTFSDSSNKRRHERICKGLVSTVKDGGHKCRKCGKTFQRAKNRQRHERACEIVKYECLICGKLCSSKRALRRHTQGHEKPPVQRSRRNNDNDVNFTQPGPSRRCERYRCRRCLQTFSNRSQLVYHGVREHQQYGAGAREDLHPEPWTDQAAPWVRENGEIDVELRDVYRSNAPIILRRQHRGRTVSLFNYAIDNSVTVDELIAHANDVYESQDNAFRLNISFGIILRNVETGEYRYFRPFFNEEVFPHPVLISRRTHLRGLRLKLRRMNVTDYLLRQRKNTKWKPHLLVNAQFVVTKTNFPLGVLSQDQLPVHIRNSKSIVALTHTRHGQPYSDNMCAFRCLGVHRKLCSEREQKEMKQVVARYLREWMEYLYTKRIKTSNERKCDPYSFGGVELNNIEHFESCFQINVNIFELSETLVAKPVYKSRCQFADTMNLNMHDTHLSLITKLNAYCRKYQCKTCDKLFATRNHIHQHESVCVVATEKIYPGGHFKPPKTIFDDLEEYGISVSNENRYYPFFAVYDFEAILTKIEEQPAEKLTYTERHDVISVAVNSNIPGHDAEHCIINPDTEALLAEMIRRLNAMQIAASKLAKQRWVGVLDKLSEMVERWKPPVVDKQQTARDGDDDEARETDEVEPPSEEFIRAIGKPNVYQEFLRRLTDENRFEIEYNDWEESSSGESENDPLDDDDNDDDDVESEYGRESGVVKKVMHNQLVRMRDKFERYCEELPVFGFHSRMYDLNLIKGKLAKHLQMHKQKQAFTVKVNNSYNCLSNARLKFLDITQYLSPGTSYSQFLKAFHVEEAKGFFPYSWFDHKSRLDYPGLPPSGTDWYSSVKNKNVLDDGLKTPEENYRWLQEIWIENGMETFRDFLHWYNCKDVRPFVLGVSKLQQYYFEEGVDVFKIAISVPGIARHIMFQESTKEGVTFAVCDKENKDLYEKIRRGLVGGPSIIFKRHCKVGSSFIRNNPKMPCKRIEGYDAAGLYLWAIGQDMPTGPFVRRKAEENFKPRVRDKYLWMYYWMDWVKETQGDNILHKLNHRREKRVGPYLVDGYCASTNTIYEFLGCFYHSCEKCDFISKYAHNDKLKKLLLDRRDRTVQRREYLEKQGYNIVEKWECGFKSDYYSDPELQEFVDSRRPTFYRSHKGAVQQEVLLSAVRDETLFGMMEVDIRVPDTWSDEFKGTTTRSPHDYFAEFCPLFCTTRVPFDAIGPHMQHHAAQFELSEKPRKLLVGGMRARKLLLATPLLKFYLDHGMEVTKLYEVVEYVPRKCFKTFVDIVSDGRRQSDLDPDKKILGETRKLIGNSGFGSVIMNIEKHQNVVYVQGDSKARKLVNDARFKRMTEFDDEYYEVEMAKKRIVLRLPYQLGLFILNFAKLRMLSLYYNFVDRFIDRDRFECLEMDTDAIYFGWADPTLRDTIKTTMKPTFDRMLTGFCNDDAFEADDEYRFFPRSCCAKHALYDKRTAGLFKLEYDGEELVGLCSKTYIVAQKPRVERRRTTRFTSTALCAHRKLKLAKRRLGLVSARTPSMTFSRPRVLGKRDLEYKMSCKGINKRQVRNPLQIFRSVLARQTPHSATNIGFRARENSVYTYAQERAGFTYFYCKRKVLEDGVHTEPLDLTLNPWSDDDDDN